MGRSSFSDLGIYLLLYGSTIESIAGFVGFEANALKKSSTSSFEGGSNERGLGAVDEQIGVGLDERLLHGVLVGVERLLLRLFPKKSMFLTGA